MSSLLLFVALTVGAEPNSSSSDLPKEPRGFREIENDMRELFRAEATAATREERWIADLQIVALYDEVMTHRKYEQSDTLKSYRAKLWSRLTRAKKQIAKDIEQLPADLQANAPDSNASPSDSLAASGSAGGGIGPAAQGQALIELIERTIAPDHWDVNGGPGTMFYYAPLHALVIRANGDVHGRVGGILGGLRAAAP